MSRPGPRATEATPLLPPAVQETSFSLATSSSPSSSARQVSPDLLRGLLMVLMAMDHTSASLGAYPHGTGMVSENPATPIEEFSAPFPYFLRTTTHLCAGGFAMLMGMGVVYFAKSRKRQGLSPWQHIKHYAIRTVAILLVNTLSCHLSILIGMGGYIWLFNIVLPALALDYFVVGVFYTAVIYYLEPALTSALDGEGKDIPPQTGDGETSYTPNGARAPKHGSTRTFPVVNLFLVLLSVLVLWVNIWSSPEEGRCEKTLDASSAGGPLAIETLLASSLSSSPASGHSFGTSAVASDYCKSMGTALWASLFQSVTCLDLGILSAFPPVGWLSFTIFGLVYGRLLSSPSRKSSSAIRTSTIDLAFTVTFSLLFVSTRILRYGNLSTDCIHADDHSSHHSTHSNQYLTSWRAFFYIVKYPPSPAYAFFSLAGNFLLLYLFSVLTSSSYLARISSLLTSPSNPLLVYGRNPLFFYGGHFWVLKIISVILPYLPFEGAQPTLDPSKPVGGWNRPRPHVGLGGLFWGCVALVLVVMYVACLEYGRWKMGRGTESVWRFL